MEKRLLPLIKHSFGAKYTSKTSSFLFRSSCGQSALSRSLFLAPLLAIAVNSAHAEVVLRKSLPPLGGLVEISRSDTIAPLTFSKPRRSAKKTERAACDGKLGVHRTIKISRKHGFLLGLERHGGIGLKPKEIVLSFDDGPRPGITEPILRALAEECVLATFFAVGRAARSAPKLLARTAREGHTIGTHSQSHPLLTKQDDEGVRAEVRRGLASAKWALKGSGHDVSNFFRYPYLDRSLRTDAVVKNFGLIGFHVNIDSLDWKDQTPDDLLQTTLRRTRAEGSGIVLFHDIQHKTAVVLPAYLRALHREGYKIVHLVPGDDTDNPREELIASSSSETAKSNHARRSDIVNVSLADGQKIEDTERQSSRRLFRKSKKQRREDEEQKAIKTVLTPPTPKIRPQIEVLASADPTAIRPQSLVFDTKIKRKRKKRFRRLRNLFANTADR